MSIVISATEARNNFFDILKRAIYGDEVILVSMAGAEKIVKIESVPDSARYLKKLFGSLNDEDAKNMKLAVKEMRKSPWRKVKELN